MSEIRLPRVDYTELPGGEGVGMYSVVDRLDACTEALRYINAYKELAVDCEGYNLGRSGTLTLLQIATPDKRVYLFRIQDPDAREKMMAAGLRAVLESSAVKKIMHDCRNDSDALYHHAGVSLKGVIDTQMGHAALTKSKFGRAPIPMSYKNALLFALSFICICVLQRFVVTI